ncbi:hypothetical protein WN51_05231 [Melipona quadrifasciata]|uniref:Uncharacterized protein n=1 Tax=Melipona quadrifasciata TaxID=166423 RepID=A0A0N0BDC8_9HYME|nr:hypothetical protein WN51_05231 [Melipona quadrifasciata]
MEVLPQGVRFRAISASKDTLRSACVVYFQQFCRPTCSFDHRADALLSLRISIRAIKSSHNYEASDRCIVRGETLRGSLGAGQEAETKQRRETADSQEEKGAVDGGPGMEMRKEGGARACRALTHFSSFYIGEGTRRNATNATGYFHSEGSFLKNHTERKTEWNSLPTLALQRKTPLPYTADYYTPRIQRFKTELEINLTHYALDTNHTSHTQHRQYVPQHFVDDRPLDVPA